MIQSEINEIKKTLKFTDCSIQKLTGCFVDIEKNMHIMTNSQFLCLPEEEQHKYFDLIKKGLSGKVGKNLLNLNFGGEDVGEKKKFMQQVVSCELKDDELMERFFSAIKDCFSYVDNYYIMVIYGVYDVPGKTTDGILMDDASDEVYNFTLTLLCPMKQSKAGLTYNVRENTLENASRTVLLEQPINAFLYPAFTDRHMDIHNILFYTKKPDDIDENLIEGLFGLGAPSTPKTQSENFVEAVSNIPALTFDSAKNICTSVSERQEEAKEDEYKATMTKSEVVNILEASGIKETELEDFERVIEKEIEENGQLVAGNIIEKNNKLTVNTGVTQISMPLEFSSGIDVRNIDGKNCLVIEINDELTVNGMRINKFN
jgi:hypothetical protein